MKEKINGQRIWRRWSLIFSLWVRKGRRGFWAGGRTWNGIGFNFLYWLKIRARTISMDFFHTEPRSKWCWLWNSHSWGDFMLDVALGDMASGGLGGLDGFSNPSNSMILEPSPPSLWSREFFGVWIMWISVPEEEGEEGAKRQWIHTPNSPSWRPYIGTHQNPKSKFFTQCHPNSIPMIPVLSLIFGSCSKAAAQTQLFPEVLCLSAHRVQNSPNIHPRALCAGESAPEQGKAAQNFVTGLHFLQWFHFPGSLEPVVPLAWLFQREFMGSAASTAFFPQIFVFNLGLSVFLLNRSKREQIVSKAKCNLRVQPAALNGISHKESWWPFVINKLIGKTNNQKKAKENECKSQSLGDLTMRGNKEAKQKPQKYRKIGITFL